MHYSQYLYWFWETLLQPGNFIAGVLTLTFFIAVRERQEHYHQPMAE